MRSFEHPASAHLAAGGGGAAQIRAGAVHGAARLLLRGSDHLGLHHPAARLPAGRASGQAVTERQQRQCSIARAVRAAMQRLELIMNIPFHLSHCSCYPSSTDVLSRCGSVQGSGGGGSGEERTACRRRCASTCALHRPDHNCTRSHLAHGCSCARLCRPGPAWVGRKPQAPAEAAARGSTRAGQQRRAARCRATAVAIAAACRRAAAAAAATAAQRPGGNGGVGRPPAAHEAHGDQRCVGHRNW